jgi:hypothetical protein
MSLAAQCGRIPVGGVCGYEVPDSRRIASERMDVMGDAPRGNLMAVRQAMPDNRTALL